LGPVHQKGKGMILNAEHEFTGAEAW
jgi:hypothetical protein